MAGMYLRWLASWLVAGLLCLPVQAEAVPAPKPQDEAGKERPPPVPQATLAFLLTVLVLLVVCMPSRRD